MSFVSQKTVKLSSKVCSHIKYTNTRSQNTPTGGNVDAGVPTGIGAGVTTVMLSSMESSLNLPAVGVGTSVGGRVGGTGRGGAEY